MIIRFVFIKKQSEYADPNTTTRWPPRQKRAKPWESKGLARMTNSTVLLAFDK
jgi:hypothetical protein